VVNAAARALLGLLWLLHWLPFPALVALGRGLGRLMLPLARSRRRVAQRNLALCFPELDDRARQALLREHFALLGRSLLERAWLWHASEARIRRRIHIEGDVHLPETSAQPVMWLAPHFLALEVTGAAVQLFQTRPVANIYAAQSQPLLDAALLAGRERFGRALMFKRQDSALPVVRAIKRGAAFLNMPDMDFGLRDAAFVPFFGVPASTLLAPSRMAGSLGMLVQPVTVQMLPGGQGYRLRFHAPWTDWPSADAEADARRMNAWIEAAIREMPAQYLWVHKRFKTRPPGEPSLYD